MNNQSVNHFPKAASLSLAFLLIAIAVLAGYGETHATPAAPEAVNTAAYDELVWVRQDSPVINVNDDPTYWEATEHRFLGSYGQHMINETEITYHERWVDHEVEWYDMTLQTKFDRPPLVLTPPIRYQIKATASHSGSLTYGSIGMQFWYSSSYSAVIEPKEVLPYYPFADDFDGTSTKEWMINPPSALHEGETFEITASWWNCPPCNVTWTYKAEPATAIPRASLEVLEPSVVYHGDEVAPGTSFLPETCDADDSCAHEIEMSDRARAIAICIKQDKSKSIALMEVAEWGRADDIHLLGNLIGWFADYDFEGSCERKVDDPNYGPGFFLPFVIEDGAVMIHNDPGIFAGSAGETLEPAATAQKSFVLSVESPLATAYSEEGVYLVGYGADTNTAIFRTYSGPLTIVPKSGSQRILPPQNKVVLTSKGFGPVIELPHLYLPMLTR